MILQHQNLRSFNSWKRTYLQKHVESFLLPQEHNQDSEFGSYTITAEPLLSHIRSTPTHYSSNRHLMNLFSTPLNDREHVGQRRVRRTAIQIKELTFFSQEIWASISVRPTRRIMSNSTVQYVCPTLFVLAVLGKWERSALTWQRVSKFSGSSIAHNSQQTWTPRFLGLSLHFLYIPPLSRSVHPGFYH